MKKKLLSFFALTVIGVLAFAATQATQASRRAGAVDITIAAADITDGDITAALTAKIGALAADETVGNITITLDKAVAYKVTAPIEGGGSIAINGSGATIDASALTAPFILMSKTPAVAGTTVGTNEVYNVAEVSVKDVEITGLPYQLFFANGVRYLVGKLSVDNSVIGINGTNKKTIFDFAGRGCAEEISVNNSTIWANPSNAQNGGLYSSQSGDWAGDLGGTKQILSITNSTIYNIANGKTICTQRQNSKPGMGFVVKNSIILDSGKSGQFVVGLDGGSYKSAPTWDIDKNAFNFGGADVSAAESAKVVEGGGTADIIKNSIAGVVAFANTDYATTGNFTLGASSLQNKLQIGDPRWQVEFVGFDVKVVNTEGLTITPEVTKAAVGEKVYCTYVLAEDYKLERPDFVDDDNNPIEFVDGTTCGLEEVGGVEKMWIIMPAKNVTIKAKVTAMPKFYIIGDMNGWDRTAMTKMTRNEETGRYEYEYAPTTTAYFAFADKQFTEEEAAADPNWETFNTTRYSLGEGNVDATLGEIKSLVKGVNGTIVLQPGTYKIVVEPDFNAVTITGEVTPPTPVTVDKLYIMGTGTPKGWVGTTELTFNETAQAFEYEATVTTEETYLTFGDAEFTSWDDFNGKHRYAPGEGNTEAVLDAEVQLVLVNDGNVLLKTPGTYKISVTKDLKMTITTGGTGINGIYVDGEAADIFSDGKPVYNLSGQRVFKGYKGIVIKNGKKVVIK